MRFIPSIVDMGPPTLRGFLAKIAPHRDIRKLREIVHFLYDTNKSLYQQRVDAVTQAEKNDTSQGPGRDIVSVLSECGPSFQIMALDTPVIVQQNRGADVADKVSDDELISRMG
jgi:hypothetical protein